jgi:hypothetical protein
MHGNTPTLVKHLRPLLIEHSAHYLSGHDHCMEHFIENGESVCLSVCLLLSIGHLQTVLLDSPVNYMLSGMGVECCYFPFRKTGVPEGLLKWYVARDNASNTTLAGFSAFEVNKSGMTISYYDQVSNSVYVLHGLY